MNVKLKRKDMMCSFKRYIRIQKQPQETANHYQNVIAQLTPSIRAIICKDNNQWTLQRGEVV